MLRVLFLSLFLGGMAVLAWEDAFDGKTLDARWQWRVPVPGPTLSLAHRPGWLRIRIPESPDGFNHWNEPKPVDAAPQLRTSVPEGDWQLETRIHLEQFAPANSFLLGLVVGTSNESLLTIGSFQYSDMPTAPEVWFEPTGTSGLSRLSLDARDVYLRLVKKGNICRGQASRDGKTWTESGCYLMGQTPRFLGLIGKTFSAGPPVVFDVDYVRLTSRPAPESSGRRALIGIGGDYPTGYRGMLARLGLPYEVLLDYQLADATLLRQFDLLLIGSLSNGIENQAREAFMEYVRGGGTALLDAQAYPPPAVVPGKGGRLRDLPDFLLVGPANPLLPWLGDTTRFAAGESRFHLAPDSTEGLQMLARYSDQPTPKGKPPTVPAGTPAIWAMPLGRGLFVYSAPSIGASLSWGPTHDRLAEALLHCLAGDRAKPQLVEEGARFGRKQSGLTEDTPEPVSAQPPTFAWASLSVPREPLPDGAAQIRAKPAPEFNLSGVYHPQQTGQLLLNHWSRRFVVSVHFRDRSVRLARIENGKTADQAELQLDGSTEHPFLLKERRGRIVLRVGEQQTGIHADGLWEGALAATGTGFANLRYQPVEPAFLNDDFMRGEEDQGSWEVISGKWSVRAKGDPRMGANPFTYSGEQDQGIGLAATGLPFWDDYALAVSVKPTSASGSLGLAFHFRDRQNYLLFRVRIVDSPDQGPDGAELVRVCDGQETVLARGNACLVREQWYRLAVQTQDGVATAAVDGTSVLQATDAQLPAGKIALLVQQGRTEFDDVVVRAAAKASRPEWVELDGSVPRFAGTMDRDTWAGSALQWRADPLVPGLFWRHGSFFGDIDLTFACNFGEGQSALALLLTPQDGTMDSGYGAVLRTLATRPADPDQRSYAVELTRHGVPWRQGTVTAGPNPQLSLRRIGAHLTVRIDGREVLECPLPEPVGELTRLGFRASGFLPRISGLRLQAGNVLDYCFDHAPTDWWVGGGSWELAVRWPCTPEWSWLAGESRGIAALWHKRQFVGDQTLDLHVGPRTVDHGDKRPREICRAFNVVLCGDGQDVRSGYSFVVGANKNGSGATFSRNGQVIAQESAYRIYSDAHNQWINVRAEKQGAQVRLWVGDQQLFSWHDPDPLPGGKLAVWTMDNGIMIPRVTIYHAGEARAVPNRNPDRSAQ